MRKEITVEEFELLRRRFEVLEKHFATLTRYVLRTDRALRRLHYYVTPGTFTPFEPLPYAKVYSKAGGTSLYTTLRLDDMEIPDWNLIGSNVYVGSNL